MKAHFVENGEEEGLFELRSSVVYAVYQVPCRLHSSDITFISRLSGLYGLMCKLHHVSDSGGSMRVCYAQCPSNHHCILTLESEEGLDYRRSKV
jgi:hypothetical protein